MVKDISPKKFIKIKIGKMRFLIPDKELLSIVSSDKIRIELSNNKSSINIDNKNLAVYIADEDMNLKPYTNEEWIKCICLHDGKLQFGIICDDASLINLSSQSYYDLPGCMRAEMNPVYGLTVYNDTIYCNTNTASLYNLIDTNN